MKPASTSLARIAVGVVVERAKAASQWTDFIWRPVTVLHGRPEAEPWTALRVEKDVTSFYAGAAEIELFRSETANYRNNLASGAPGLWVAMQPTESDPPYQLLTVTADPAEGEALTETATNLVECVPMPETIQELVVAFVAEHHVEQPFYKRKRDRADPEAMARRRGYGDHDE